MIAQTPWFERKFNFNFPVGLLPIIIERLRGAVPRIKKILKTTGNKSLVNKPNDTWSVKEQIGHLYDLEELWYGRLEDFLAGVKILRAADITNVKTTNAGHNEKEVDQLISQFAIARNNLIEKVENINEATASLLSV